MDLCNENAKLMYRVWRFYHERRTNVMFQALLEKQICSMAIIVQSDTNIRLSPQRRD